MSKNGRYSADRKKIATIAAAKTVTVPECGTVFMTGGLQWGRNHDPCWFRYCRAGFCNRC